MPRNYQEYFQVGKRAKVEMLLSDGGTFSDGAVITALSGDRLSVRLSRDELPEGALLHEKAPVSVRVGARGNGYTCRALVLSCREGEDLLMGLIEGVVAEDSRAYYRLQAEMPVTLYKMATGWKDCSVNRPLFPREDYLPRIVNISGGGLRAETEMELTPGDLVHVVFHLPLPEPKTVPVVAEVVQSESREDGYRPCYSAGMKYREINERDRDAVVAYVCNEEIKRLRLNRKEYLSLVNN
ncbi:PilZ-like domain-containing protein [Geomesophilobacter sediminis]|uniref:DUF5634 family protein n=1 Tax=Geomesophilobacter sediminis TaxID=2798584 RepID=A0A8J7JLC4_9BACT|nr:PilZ-like domain-containing protein [Geomesophilobacter sediminis]MBJ6724730.1 DUF5634 family protein [Geomesophilobacter sediminis]